MTAAIAIAPVSSPVAAPTMRLAPAERATLARLRRLAAEARLSRRTEPQGLCAALEADPAEDPDKYGAALLQILPLAAGRSITLHRIGAVSHSFDERWLIGLIRALRAEDWVNVNFALASRISRHFQRRVRYLAENFARRAG